MIKCIKCIHYVKISDIDKIIIDILLYNHNKKYMTNYLKKYCLLNNSIVCNKNCNMYSETLYYRTITFFKQLWIKIYIK